MFGFLCPVSGSTSSANITMAVCPHALSDPRAEVTLQESNQELRSQLAQSKQDFQALMEEFLVSEAAAYSLATELQKHSKSPRAVLPRWVSDPCLPSKTLKFLQTLASGPFVKITFILTTIQESQR